MLNLAFQYLTKNAGAQAQAMKKTQECWGTGLEPGAQAQAVDARELFLKAVVDAGELVWNQGLLKLFGICHDVELDRVQVDQQMSFRKRAFQRVCGGSPTNHE
ncbi:hypothetical protein ACLOJK_023759 [Asimina triloba]